MEAADGRQWLVRHSVLSGDDTGGGADRLTAGGAGVIAACWGLVVVSGVVAGELVFPGRVSGALASVAEMLTDSWVLVLLVLLVVVVLGVARHLLRRPRSVHAETYGWPDDDGSAREAWYGTAPGFTAGAREVRAVTRNLRHRATPGRFDSAMHPI